MSALGSIAPASLPCNFPFTRIDIGVHATDRTFYATNASEQTTGVSPITINIFDINPVSDTIAYSLSSGELTFKYSSKVYVTYNTAYSNTNNNRSDEKFFLERDTGSGFQLIENSEGFVYIRRSDSDNSASKTILLEVEKGNIIRLRTQRDSGSNNITQSGLCSFVINSQKKQDIDYLGLNAGIYTDPDEVYEKYRFFDAGDIDG